jgi:hypothetical protein
MEAPASIDTWRGLARLRGLPEHAISESLLDEVRSYLGVEMHGIPFDVFVDGVDQTAALAAWKLLPSLERRAALFHRALVFRPHGATHWLCPSLVVYSLDLRARFEAEAMLLGKWVHLAYLNAGYLLRPCVRGFRVVRNPAKKQIAREFRGPEYARWHARIESGELFDPDYRSGLPRQVPGRDMADPLLPFATGLLDRKIASSRFSLLCLLDDLCPLLIGWAPHVRHYFRSRAIVYAIHTYGVESNPDQKHRQWGRPHLFYQIGPFGVEKDSMEVRFHYRLPPDDHQVLVPPLEQYDPPVPKIQPVEGLPDLETVVKDTYQVPDFDTMHLVVPELDV